MNLVAALILLNILILIYQVLIEIFTTLCRINGMGFDQSKFQVISLLTGTGFTTWESEEMLLTKKRRKLTQRIMFFSYIFNVSIVSIIVNIFMSSGSTTMAEVKLGVLVTIWNIVLIEFTKRSKTIKNLIDNLVIAAVNHRNKKNDNFVSVYDTYGNKVIAEIELVKLRDDIKSKTIEEMDLKNKYGIQVMVIKRKGEIISEVWADTVIKEGDTIVVFGKMKNIKEAFVRHIEKKKKNSKPA